MHQKRTTTCGTCGTSFPRKTSGGKPNRFCSRACWNSRTPEDRFWEKVDKDGPVPEQHPELGPCWLWTAALFANGYGAFRLGSKQRRTHVVSYEWHVGSTDGLKVCHRCNVKHCVRPDHLTLGTHDDNMAYMVAEGRQATGTRNGMHAHDLTTLTDDQVREIHALCSGGAPQWAVAEQYGVTQTLISHILRGTRWGHLGLPIVRLREKKPRPSAETVRAVRRADLEGWPRSMIADTFGMSKAAVSRIVIRQAYPDIPD